MLPLPLRTTAHLLQQPAAQGGNQQAMDMNTLLALLMNKALRRSRRNPTELRNRLGPNFDARPGFLVLAAAAGCDLNSLTLSDKVAREPIGRYLGWLPAPSDLKSAGKGLGDGLLHRLAAVQSLLQHGRAGPGFPRRTATTSSRPSARAARRSLPGPSSRKSCATPASRSSRRADG